MDPKTNGDAQQMVHVNPALMEERFTFAECNVMEDATGNVALRFLIPGGVIARVAMIPPDIAVKIGQTMMDVGAKMGSGLEVARQMPKPPPQR